jgi:hypothetical protein
VLGIATPERDGGNLFTVKDLRDDRVLHRGAQWDARYLGCLLTHSRMYSAVQALSSNTLTGNPVLAGLLRPQQSSQSIPATATHPIPDLNLSQASAVVC